MLKKKLSLKKSSVSASLLLVQLEILSEKIFCDTKKIVRQYGSDFLMIGLFPPQLGKWKYYNAEKLV